MINSYVQFIRESEQSRNVLDPIMLKLAKHAQKEDIVSFVEVLCYEFPKDELFDWVDGMTDSIGRLLHHSLSDMTEEEFLDSIPEDERVDRYLEDKLDDLEYNSDTSKLSKWLSSDYMKELLQNNDDYFRKVFATCIFAYEDITVCDNLEQVLTYISYIIGYHPSKPHESDRLIQHIYAVNGGYSDEDDLLDLF